MSSPTPLLKDMNPEVLRFETGAFRLGSDLERMVNLREEGAHEGAAMYASRIVEALARAALEPVGRRSGPNLATALDEIRDRRMADRVWVSCGHGVRRLGNDARHVNRHLEQRDSDTAIAFVERWLHWFFREREGGPGVRVTSTSGPPTWVRRLDFRDTILAVRQIGPDVLGEAAIDPFFETLASNAALAAVAAERLLDTGLDADRRAAERLLDEALARCAGRMHESAQRLLQLRALAYSWGGDPVQAVGVLDAVGARLDRNPETFGIRAGALKRLAGDDLEDMHRLREAADVYDEGVRAFPDNTYLGVNAAACALWLGAAGRSRALARRVHELLCARADFAREGDLRLSGWDHLTLAEAALLAGEIQAARRAYFWALQRDDNSGKRAQVARVQLGRHLDRLPLRIALEAFPAAVGASPHGSFRVGTTGHIRTRPSVPLREWVHDCLEDLRRRLAPGRSLALVSALAAGADQIVAAGALGSRRADALDVVLPLDVADYLNDFKGSDPARRGFEQLLAKAARIRVADDEDPRCRVPRGIRGTPFDPRRVAEERGLEGDSSLGRRLAYLRAGLQMAACDALIAVWDGQPARGVGGTADIVGAARHLGTPICWILPDGSPPPRAAGDPLPDADGWERGDVLAQRLRADGS